MPRPKTYAKCHPDRLHRYHGLCKTCVKVEERAILKRKILLKYSQENFVECCGEGCSVSDPDMLSIDHVNNDGYKERKITGGGSKMYYWLLKHDFPSGYQTLCFNHQWKKRMNHLLETRQGNL
jgi:hypothetical protein